MPQIPHTIATTLQALNDWLTEVKTTNPPKTLKPQEQIQSILKSMIYTTGWAGP